MSLTVQFSSASCYFLSTLYSTTQLQDSVTCKMNLQSTPNSLEVFHLKTLSSSLAFSCSAEHIPTSLRHGRLYLITPATRYSGRSVNSWSFKYRALPLPTFAYRTQTDLHRHSRYAASSVRTIPRLYKRVRKGEVCIF